MENKLNWLLLGFIHCLLKEVDGGGALFFGGGEFLYEVDDGGEGGCLVAEGGVFGLVVQFVGHLGDEGGEECADSGIVLLEEFLAGGGGLLDGAHCGIGGLLNGLDHCLSGDMAVGIYLMRDDRKPGKECGACYSILACYG